MTNKLVCDKMYTTRNIIIRLILQKRVDIAMSTQSIILAGRQAGRISPAFLGLLKIT